MPIVHRLQKTGVTGEKSIFVHCVHIDEAEMDILAATKTSVVHNPESNMNNAVGVTRLFDLLKKGVLVGLGTDGMSSDMLAPDALRLSAAPTGQPRPTGWLSWKLRNCSCRTTPRFASGNSVSAWASSPPDAGGPGHPGLPAAHTAQRGQLPRASDLRTGRRHRGHHCLPREDPDAALRKSWSWMRNASPPARASWPRRCGSGYRFPPVEFSPSSPR